VEFFGFRADLTLTGSFGPNHTSLVYFISHVLSI